MCFLLDPAKSEEACDVGTGRGSGAGAIAEHAKRVVTFDIVDQRAHVSKLGLSNVEFRQADLAQGELPCKDGSFDIVTCRAALHHLSDRKRFFDEAFRVLRPNGRLYIMDPVMSPDLRLAWSVLSHITERDYQGYATQDELLGGVTKAGFDLKYLGHFLFPRSLKQLIDERLPLKELKKGQSESDNGNDFVAHVRRNVWDAVTQVLSDEMRSELHFDLKSPEGWYAYNCLELVALKT